MVDKRIKGITIEIDGETKKLESALKGVEKSSRDIQSELKQVERLLKLDPSNTELLAQRQTLLRDAVDASKERLEALKLAQKQAEQAFREGKIGEDQYRAIQREVIGAEQELKKLNVSLYEANSKWKQAADNIGKFGSQAEAVGKKLLPVSAAAGAALGGIVAMTAKSAKAADDLNTLSAQTGLTTEAIQKFKYATDLIDVPLETFTGSLSRLTRSMRDARDGNTKLEEAFKSLEVSATDSVGQLRDNEEVFFELIDALGRVANESERDALSMQLFGKSAQDLNPLIKAGSDELRKLGNEAKDLGLILDQETIDGLNGLNNEMDKTKAQLQSTSMVLSAEFGKVLLPLLQSLANSLQNLLEWFRGLDEGTAKTILVVLSLVAALAPLIIILGKVANGISLMMGLWTSLGAAATAAGTTVGALVAPFLAVAGVIAAVVAAGVLLYKNWDEIKEFAGRLKDTVVTKFNELKASVTNIFKSLAEINLYEIGQNIIQGLIDGIKSMISSVGNAVKNVASGAVSAVKNFLGIRSPSQVFVEIGKFTGEGFVKGIEATQNALRDATVNMGQTAVRGTTSAVTQPASRGDIIQHVTINSPKPTSPSENARLMKNAGRQMALELM